MNETIRALKEERDALKAELELTEQLQEVTERSLKNATDERDHWKWAHDTERAIVSRIWVQLGSPTYAQLKGRSIYDLIDELKEKAK